MEKIVEAIVKLMDKCKERHISVWIDDDGIIMHLSHDGIFYNKRYSRKLFESLGEVSMDMIIELFISEAYSESFKK